MILNLKNFSLFTSSFALIGDGKRCLRVRTWTHFAAHGNEKFQKVWKLRANHRSETPKNAAGEWKFHWAKKLRIDMTKLTISESFGH